MKPLNIAIIEDNDTMRLGIELSLKNNRYQLQSFADPEKALQALQLQSVELVITDLKMEPVNGIEVLRRVKQWDPAPEVIMISAYGTVDTAVEAMRLGACDFLTKPFSPDELRMRVEKAMTLVRQRQSLEELQEKNRFLQEEMLDRDQFIGESSAIRNVFNLIEAVASENSTILITGESGTGKELVAQAIHRNSPRRHKPFVRVNCGALNDNLLESELFGHEKGAFTGAIKQKKGRFELADQGTIFLDEIGDISGMMQVKLLRVLQEKEFERVGGETTLTVDVRVICATNRNLRQLMQAGTFREDLFYRLSVIPIPMPPLRDRPEDIPLLVDHFLSKLSGFNPERHKIVSPQSMELLKSYPWPGNVRELQNVIERLYVISKNHYISPDLVASQLSGRHTPSLSDPLSSGSISLDDCLYRYEKSLILQALEESHGVKNRAAKRLGIKTNTLYYKLEKFGLL
ncbi:MAG: sigma-54-dependent Fis family transcriptional regulator [Candidatus Delongbacteria bacterium]|nr:sigma-54-dependent Fis family transcriptional regulator [Candidatus Delongbacteria bacterium]